MSLKKAEKNSITLNQFYKFISKQNYCIKNISLKLKTFLILSLIKLRINYNLQHLQKSQLLDLYNQYQNFDSEDFVINLFNINMNSTRKAYKELVNLKDNLINFYSNSGVLVTNNKYLLKQDENEHQIAVDKFINLNYYLDELLTFLKKWFPTSFNFIFRKIIIQC
ncbi:hypothetical protein [Malacoplasma iowae]|uniref:Uncharacterized protein n=2 Tax=Malacoplasma iowae TaxID=2116 RepID=A0A084U4K9_MALIO|nr:hypothetical protein [Malacoplasma iowae]VEU63096.1 Uncharacterised protein [Mycoplasmopsis fermentans]EGZ30964.1 hypothetical protein GUU_00227 [Malacoplasma iowae 695]KFB07895.1 hypothetical protein P271_759 [Malacoplasma iowae DK-CPA]QHG89528.1 hypothetical protein EER00_01265 [Malacoplasma iowae 695]WPL35695.1 hypothetical protein QX180_05215 [Malacoplasma iowae]